MQHELLRRIDELRRLLAALRSRPCDSVAQIGIDALQQELGRLARQLPPEWSLAASAGVNAGARAD